MKKPIEDCLFSSVVTGVELNEKQRNGLPYLLNKPTSLMLFHWVPCGPHTPHAKSCSKVLNAIAQNTNTHKGGFKLTTSRTIVWFCR